VQRFINSLIDCMTFHVQVAFVRLLLNEVSDDDDDDDDDDGNIITIRAM